MSNKSINIRIIPSGSSGPWSTSCTLVPGAKQLAPPMRKEGEYSEHASMAKQKLALQLDLRAVANRKQALERHRAYAMSDWTGSRFRG